MKRKCRTCGKKLRVNELVVPVLAVYESTRYEPAPGPDPVAYIHLKHFTTKET
ncbi:hypothetical protein SEA_PEPE25_87 [Microbacterium phage Pepe25]|nr:hypothetical protein SEA_PEPE25_87 [Microbacterium phage Pepe25]